MLPSITRPLRWTWARLTRTIRYERDVRRAMRNIGISRCEAVDVLRYIDEWERRERNRKRPRELLITPPRETHSRRLH